MSEIENTGTEQTVENGNSSTGSTSVLNQAIESVMDLIDALGLFALITRGALGTGNGLCCEMGPTTPETIWLDKNKYIPIDLTINGKHENLQTLSDAMNMIHESLTIKRSYPDGQRWQIVDIQTLTEPQVIARDSSNKWLMASALSVKVATDLSEPGPPTPEPVAEPTSEQITEQE